MTSLVQFASPPYFLMLALLLFARGMDFLSTWAATPNLALEGNPLAKKMGWKWGGVVNFVLCVGFALWPLTAIIVITSALLVAAHNFRSAWLMRTLGEDQYRQWFGDRLAEARLPVYLACLTGETLMTAIIGTALVLFSRIDSVAYAVGFGIIAYSVIVFFYTSLSMWRLRRGIDRKAASVLSDPI